MTDNEPFSKRRVKLLLALASGLVLFLELSLIRWAGSNVVHLSYFSNFILLGSFLGIGLGFLIVRRQSLLWIGVYALALFVLLVRIFPVEVQRDYSTLLFFGGSTLHLTGFPVWLTLPVIFVFITAIFVCLGQTVGQLFQKLPSLEAYRFDLLGSIAGIVLFSLMSFMGLSPIAWGILVSIGILFLLPRSRRLVVIVPLLAIVACLSLESFQPATWWSAYYRVNMYEGYEPDAEAVIRRFDVNGILHQAIVPTSLVQKFSPFYRVPYLRYGSTAPDNVLIIGAGTGTDVAVALDAGAQRVDAVEIDATLADLGRRYNPDRPYSDPRVRLSIADGRSFLEQTREQYDLIVFALPDSLTLVSGQSSLRLESYMFTVQAFAAASRHLKSDGVFALYNYYREPWLIDRLNATVRKVYGHNACIEDLGMTNSFAMLTVGRLADRISCPDTWVSTDTTIKPVTDRYPFLYLQRPTIPNFYLLTIITVLFLAYLAFRSTGSTIARIVPYLDLFWMGAAFLLLETMNVVHFALLFGTTWFVNALVFAGILLIVYLTVTLRRRIQIRRYWPWYVALFASLLPALLIPDAWLLRLDSVARAIVAVTLSFVPIVLANCIFSARLRESESSTDAFGANLLGALVGGLIEYVSLIVGYNGLIVGVGVLYTIALLTLRRNSTAARKAI
ncbi:MAG: spermidine synthase [Candidatus Kerfeldbacteria bacterium]